MLHNCLTYIARFTAIHRAAFIYQKRRYIDFSKIENMK